jgi:hypothetical protein
MKPANYFPFGIYLEFRADIVKLFLARMAEEQFAKIFSEKLFVAVAVFILPLETKENTFLELAASFLVRV